MRLKRVYRKISDWEETRHGMWDAPINAKEQMSQAIKFTSDHMLYGSYMEKVINNWPNSCENSLTNYSINRRAWLGHAAVSLALNIPQSITRKAWSKLTHEQRFLADKQAERYIRIWEDNYIKSRNLYSDMAQPLLL